MSAVVSLTSLPDALAELEQAAGIVLLAVQENEPTHGAIDRLRRALLTLTETRELAAELAAATGRPHLRLIVGGRCASACTTSD